MSQTEKIRFAVYKKKLNGLCEEHNLVATFNGNTYPSTMVIKTTGDISGQMSMLADVEENSFRSPDAMLIFSFKDGSLNKETRGGNFRISETLENKLKLLYKKMHSLWLQHFHRTLIEEKIISSDNLPIMPDDDEGDVPDETFDEIADEAEPVEEYAGETPDDYDYDEPEE